MVSMKPMSMQGPFKIIDWYDNQICLDTPDYGPSNDPSGIYDYTTVSSWTNAVVFGFPHTTMMSSQFFLNGTGLKYEPNIPSVNMHFEVGASGPNVLKRMMRHSGDSAQIATYDLSALSTGITGYAKYVYTQCGWRCEEASGCNGGHSWISGGMNATHLKRMISCDAGNDLYSQSEVNSLLWKIDCHDEYVEKWIEAQGESPYIGYEPSATEFFWSTDKGNKGSGPWFAAMESPPDGNSSIDLEQWYEDHPCVGSAVALGYFTYDSNAEKWINEYTIPEGSSNENFIDYRNRLCQEFLARAGGFPVEYIVGDDIYYLPESDPDYNFFHPLHNYDGQDRFDVYYRADGQPIEGIENIQYTRRLTTYGTTPSFNIGVETFSNGCVYPYDQADASMNGSIEYSADDGTKHYATSTVSITPVRLTEGYSRNLAAYEDEYMPLSIKYCIDGVTGEVDSRPILTVINLSKVPYGSTNMFQSRLFATALGPVYMAAPEINSFIVTNYRHCIYREDPKPYPTGYLFDRLGIDLVRKSGANSLSIDRLPMDFKYNLWYGEGEEAGDDHSDKTYEAHTAGGDFKCYRCPALKDEQLFFQDGSPAYMSLLMHTGQDGNWYSEPYNYMDKRPGLNLSNTSRSITYQSPPRSEMFGLIEEIIFSEE